MRFPIAAAMALILGAAPAAIGQFEAGRDEAQRFNPDDPFHEKAYRKFLESLGPGPVYRVEVLYRNVRGDDEDGRLYYLRSVVGKKKRSRTFGLGLDDAGKPIPAPNPGHDPIANRADEASNPPAPPPLAAETGHIGAFWDETDDKKSLCVRVGDQATATPPLKLGEEAVVCYLGAIFYVTRLTAEQLDKERPLRNDPAFFKSRTSELHKFLMTAYVDKLKKSDEDLSLVTVTLQDPALIAEVRKRIAAWIELPPAERNRSSLSGWLQTALCQSGDAGDFALLERLAKTAGEPPHQLRYETLALAKRAGGAKAMPLFTAQVSASTPAGDDVACFPKLKALAPAIPRPQAGDFTVANLVREFRLDPAKFHLSLAESELLKRVDRSALTAKELDELTTLSRNPRYDHWIFLSERDREQGHQAALDWMAAYPGRK